MNALILRLKNSIDKKILESIDKNLMGQHNFVPISVKDNFLFVAVSKNSNKDEINSILKKSFQQAIKFMLVGEDDLRELLASFIPAENLPAAPVASQSQGLPAQTAAAPQSADASAKTQAMLMAS